MAQRGRNSGSMFWIATLSSGGIAALLAWGLNKIGVGHGTAVAVGGWAWLVLIIPFWVMFHNLNEDDRARRAVDREERRAKERARRRGETYTPPHRRKRHARVTPDPPAQAAPVPVESSGQAPAMSARSESAIPEAPRPAANTTVVCDRCGASLDVSASFCSACGARSPLNPPPKDVAWETERRSYVRPLGEPGSASAGPGDHPPDGGE
jgi:ribosomal protein L37E